MTWTPKDPKEKDKDLKPLIVNKQVHVDEGKGWNSGGDKWDKDTRRDKFDSIRDQAIEALIADGKFTSRRLPNAGSHEELLDWSWRMWVWGRRVRRDMLVLEKQLDAITGLKIPKFDDPGDPPPPPDLETL